MQALHIIEKKRDGHRLSEEELAFIVWEYHRGNLPDYQMAAFLMSLFIRGFDDKELIAYTRALVNSGRILDWGASEKKIVDKHSSGGVGDNTTLVVAPLVAASGLCMPKMAGRGLGHTGGTLDKLESIPGFSAGLTIEALQEQVAEIGLAVVSQTDELTPADGKIYALRDVTATVDSTPLIAASIMSKKIAGGAPSLVLDVKAGRGAFMKTTEAAQHLGQNMVKLGESLGRKVAVVISNMDQPLGHSIGNALEVREAAEVLQGKGAEDLKNLSLTLASHLLVSAGKAEDMKKACLLLDQKLSSGAAYEKFIQLIEHQGGDTRFLESSPSCFYLGSVYADQDGYLQELDALLLGKAASFLGAGRFKKDDLVDPHAGLMLHAKVGDRVKKGEALVSLYSQGRNPAPENVEKLLEQAVKLSANPVKTPGLVYHTLKG